MKQIALIALALLTTSACASPASHYQDAITQSALHYSESSVKPLTTLQGTKATLVVYTTYNGYKITDTSVGATIWTTVAPEVKDLCRQYVQRHKHQLSSQELALWLAQLLGLPAKDADKRRFVELEVPVIQAYYGAHASKLGIFRPCTDPRIGKHHDDSPICPKQMDPNDSNISTDFKTWFINTSIAAHTLDNGMPWTEYGYTYNWNEHANSTFGVTEFVVVKNTPVTVLPSPSDPTTPYISPDVYCGLD